MCAVFEQWDITSSVGLTALGVASARAVETDRADPLVSDPYAAAFVRAADSPRPLPARLEDTSVAGDGWFRHSRYLGVRSRFFDEYFAASTAAGIHQVVLLAAGLDTRAYRLDWPDGCELYEVDQPKVLAFKRTVLDEQAASARCRRHEVATDLRDDWESALLGAGFDPRRPTAWLAEGLLPYLPGRAEEGLFEVIHRLSAAGSRLAVERASIDRLATLRDHPLFREAFEEFGADVSQLWNAEPRRDCADWLRSAGWTAAAESAQQAGQRYGLPMDDPFDEVMGTATLLTATREHG
ncbi:SAM-dependent methyltransferase [Amycolatopsis cihanbeyliensis]|uniref:S-adenosyl-L-methionine-dependent methyltransferase n=1 Tax=Amycolatopsis cihanbeyliensis TaxID=1128664 RepID=A0A542DN22_AMYCI|nr:SAM-dependent methyltransferase [Amycolatopsis cihanbeyliensis]TQJ04457.1 methyltransferase (TIGR00027 family) [Amycolatopsis cihanbeyliensis]